MRTTTTKRRDVRVQQGVLAILTLAIAYGAGAWVQVLHHAEGAAEIGEPAPVAHWLRDSTLSVPLIAVAVFGGLLLARRLVAATDARPGFAVAITATVVGAAATYVLAAGNPIHGLLFPAVEGTGHHQEHGLLVHAARDGLVALPAVLLIAAATCAALARRRPWAPVSPVPPRLAVRLAVPVRRTAIVFGALAPVVLVVQLAPLAGAGGGAGRPCPAAAPVKTFDVRAIDVDIPLNRFGDHDPNGKMYVLADQVAAVRAQEQARQVSVGLRDDPIQPLVIRANLGDCVEVNFTNNASGGEYGFSVDGLAFGIESSGDAVGNNVSSSTVNGETRTYRFWLPRDKTLEGAHYIRPGAGQRQAIAHGLFGTLVAEPPGSKYLHPDTGKPLASGWEAMIVPGNGQKAFREYTEIMHEIGDESAEVMDRNGQALPMVDPTTDAYRPGSRAINYRSEPFMRRMERKGTAKSHAYSSYVFGDPATPISRGYLGDPTKRRVVHGGSEMFHVYHLHGGGIRWRANPHADSTFDYQDTGLRKHPPASQSASSRLDSQSMGPGETYDLQMEGGAGGVQQVAGEFLWHCHIAEHYVAGMWTFWRVFDTQQPDLAKLPDRGVPPKAVDSTGLVGKTINGQTITKDNLDEWIKPQLPPQGVPADNEDATVWNYDVQPGAAGDLYLGEPEHRGAWPNLRDGEHPGGMPGDVYVGDRPKIRFNPTNGRPAFPLLRPNIGQRPPFSPNGHSGAPWLGEKGNAPKASGVSVDPWANRPDGICPAGANTKTFNVVAIEANVPVHPGAGGTDTNGKIFVLAQDKDAVISGEKEPEPLVIRANQGECVALTLTSEFVDAKASDLFSKVNMHVHHVQFDTQASDGVISGLSYEQSIRPYATESRTLSSATTVGMKTLELSNADRLRPGVDIAVGMGETNIEIGRIATIEGTTVTLEKPLNKAHAAGEAAGVEFVQSRWYPDVLLDNVFWHDHVDGIHGWGHGLVGQIVVEPPGSTYHDPQTGEQIESGAIADIRTNGSLIGNKVTGDFREFALFTIDQNPVTDSTINLRAAPFSRRLGTDPDPSLLFSSYRHGDPNTPTLKAYRGDNVVIRAMNVAPGTDTVRVEGHRFDQELRLPGTKKDTIVQGVSERFSLALDGGAGGGKRTGDFLYHNGIQRRFRQGAWGLFRVFSERRVAGLQPLRNNPVSGTQTEPTQTNGRPPVVGDGGQPCTPGQPTRTFDVSAVDVGATPSFVIREGANAEVPAQPTPLVLHAAAGDCVTVNLKNERQAPPNGLPPRVSFHVSEVDRTERSSGINAGFNPEQTVAVGEERTYRFNVDSADIGSAVIGDMGDPNATAQGAYGALIVAPAGAQFRDPQSGLARDHGDRVDVHLGNGDSYRDLTVTLADTDPVIGGDFTPYKTAVEEPSSLSQRANVRTVGAAMFSSRANGDPSTPILTAYPGDPVRVHAIGAPGSEQPHVFGLGGLTFPIDPRITNASKVSTLAMGPWSTIDAHVSGGAGGINREQGDFFYGDVRSPFTEAGLWGLMRVTSDGSCPVRPLPGADCIGKPSLATDEPPTPVRPAQPQPEQQQQQAPAPAPAPAPQTQRQTPTPTPQAAPSKKAAVRLSRLRLTKRVKLADLAKKGLVFRIVAPERSRAVEVVLSRRTKKGSRAVLRTIGRLRGGGDISVRWRPKSAQVARLKPGRYRLAVRVGSARKKLGRERVSRAMRLVGPRLP